MLACFSTPAPTRPIPNLAIVAGTVALHFLTGTGQRQTAVRVFLSFFNIFLCCPLQKQLQLLRTVEFGH